jgi:hypothetical protein
MALAKGLNVIFERPFVLKIRAANAIPKLATILLMSSPITSHSE